jgi:hypothetical protein
MKYGARVGSRAYAMDVALVVETCQVGALSIRDVEHLNADRFLLNRLCCVTGALVWGPGCQGLSARLFSGCAD